MIRFDPDDPDETREAVRRLFANTAQAPRDVVPSTGLTREDLERQSAAYVRSEQGQPSTGTIPGEILLDPDGMPVGVGPSRTVTASFGGTFITAAQAEQFGIAPDELPGIFIIDNEEY
ncbi:hypothetical protein BN970_04599 [Mycolicibacterium conceptionense]|uniref:Uncharacterized protein n=1 Tax=Mycolicibacterium conceptionense TaxID=451644 RepID=A0A0U1DQM4_9MYCO|nr:hypothetical protein [Mycolicibacterium conceptionense]ORV25526.1 hypothetical protein AWB98_18030 [Mycolicibacterium conceptionense]CQD20028.1 hypothetical protein BN970_04599 [Mycolicibacterium conceptionense]